MPIVSWTPIRCAIDDLRAHAVGGGRQQRAVVRAQGRRVEQPGEPAEPADDLGALRPRDRGASSARRRCSPASTSTPAAAYVVAAPAPRPALVSTSAGSPEGSSVTGGSAHRLRRRRRPAPTARRRRAPRVRAARRRGRAAAACPTARPPAVGTGYTPSKQARHSRSFATPVAVDEALQRDVAQGVGADGAADLVDREPVRDELGAGGEVDAVEARPLDRRRGDPDVDLGGAGLAQHPDQGALGVAAHDRVVDDDEPLDPR